MRGQIIGFSVLWTFVLTINYIFGIDLGFCRGSNLRAMTGPLFTILLMLPLFAQGGEKRVLGSASYKDVCAKMAAAGITSRTQTTPTTDSIADNVLVVSGLDDLNQSRENRLVSNTKIFVGANVMVSPPTLQTVVDPLRFRQIRVRPLEMRKCLRNRCRNRGTSLPHRLMYLGGNHHNHNGS